MTNGLRIAGVALVLLGVLALVYGGFEYTEDSEHVKLGPIEFSVKEKESVHIPVWAGVAAVVAGTGLLLASTRKP